MGIQVIPPGCLVQEHSHDRQVEILFCFEDEGEIEVDGNLPAPPWWQHPGSSTKSSIPARATLKMTWTITPPGLETYFRQIGRPRKPGEALPAPFDPPEAADEIQRETGFGDLQR